MIEISPIIIKTKKQFQMIKITDKVKKFVNESNIRNGIVVIISTHTTTGIIVNEGLECVEDDIEESLNNFFPDDAPYNHAHFLPSYGATGSNAPSHLKSLLTGNNCMFVIEDGQLIAGGAQDIYFADYDGPKRRKVYMEIIGE